MTSRNTIIRDMQGNKLGSVSRSVPTDFCGSFVDYDDRPTRFKQIVAEHFRCRLDDLSFDEQGNEDTGTYEVMMLDGAAVAFLDEGDGLGPDYAAVPLLVAAE